MSYESANSTINMVNIIYRGELFLKASIYLIVCTGVLILLVESVRSRPLTLVGLIALLLPLPFLPVLFRQFTKPVKIVLSPEQISFEIMNKNGPIEKVIPLSNLKSYSMQFPTEKFSSIRFVSWNGRSEEFSFFTYKKDSADSDTAELIGHLRESIKEYNKRRDTATKIAFSPSFYASDLGLYANADETDHRQLIYVDQSTPVGASNSKALNFSEDFITNRKSSQAKQMVNSLRPDAVRFIGAHNNELF